MDGTQTAVVTGANSGIGLETARGLAREGMRVLLLCRSRERGEAAVADIEASVPGAALELVVADLGLQADVRRAADDISARAPHLDVLVNNAGITVRTRELTTEGIDVMLAVNHLGPFLLTNLLLPVLRAGAPARIVTVASEAHKLGKLRLDDLQATRGYGLLGFPRYGETKLMNILFTRELARRIDGSGVTANCLHPGAVRTNLGHPPAPLRALLGLFFIDAVRGAETTLAVATRREFADVNGSYFAKSQRADDQLSAAATDTEAATALWKASEELVGGLPEGAA